MLRPRLKVLAALLALAVGACAARPAWLEVQSPHFLVVCNADAVTARQVAGQLERMRAVFRQAFPTLQVDPPMPILVLALRNQKDFEAVEPAGYAGKGKLPLAGYFQRSPERNYIVMRLDAIDDARAGGFPYAVIYHEYTHLLTFKDDAIMPVWLAEGLAEFYQTTLIDGNEVSLGQPDPENLDLLRHSRLLPLATLFAVDHASPYYHERDKGTIFYAESWALTHFLMMGDRNQHTQRLATYVNLLQHHTDAAAAAATAFGDLNALQKALARYIQQLSFSYVRFKIASPVDDRTLPAEPISDTQADAVRGDFLAHLQRYAEAQSLLVGVLQSDPHNLEALEALGFAAAQQGERAAALQFYGQAAALGSQDFLAQYYFGAYTMQAGGASLGAADASRVEASLAAAIRLNSAFAPAYDELAVFYAQRHAHLEQADRLEMQAITLDPGNVDFRLNTASILTALNRNADAIAVLQAAQALAATPAEKQLCAQRLQQAQQYGSEQQQYAQAMAQRAAESRQEAATPPALVVAHTSANTTPDGPPQIARTDAPYFADGGGGVNLAATIQKASCGPNHALELDFLAQGKPVHLHIPDLSLVVFTDLRLAAHAPLNPCTDLAGKQAAITFSKDQVTAIAISR